MRDVLRADRGVKVRTLKRGRPALLVVTRRTSPAASLRRIDRVIKSGKDHLYAKAITEAPADAMALIEQVRGSVEWSREKSSRLSPGFQFQHRLPWRHICKRR